MLLQSLVCAVNRKMEFISDVSIPVVVWTKAWVYGRSLAGIVGSNLTEGIDISCEDCVKSGRGLCVWQFLRPGNSYRVFCE